MNDRNPMLETSPPADSTAAVRGAPWWIQTVGFVVLIGVAAAIANYLFASAPEARRRAPPERQARLVEVEPARAGDAIVTVTAWGEVRASRELVLRPEVSGRVAKVSDRLEPGGRLGAGEPVLAIDPRDYAVRLERAKTDLVRARADLAIERGRQAVAKREFELVGQRVDENERALMLREPQLATAEAAVRAAQASVDEARLALERTELGAPFDALVVARSVALGSQVGPSSDVATLVSVDRWWIEAAIPVRALRWIEIPGDAGGDGSKVRIHYDSAWPDGASREGVVVRRLGDLEAQGRMARILVEVRDPLAAPALLIGAFVRLEILGRTLPGAFALRPAWLRDGDTVWIAGTDARLEVRAVEVAFRSADRVLLTGGLAPGERIVTSDIATAVDGMPVRVSDGEAPAAGGRAPGAVPGNRARGRGDAG